MCKSVSSIMAESAQPATETEEDEDEGSSPICRILEWQLANPAILRHVYGDMSSNLYIMLDDDDDGDDSKEGAEQRLRSDTSVWRPALYAMLAYQGFMVIAYGEKMLLPEMQKTQCIIDWANLHVSKKARKLAKTGRYSISVNRAFDKVISGIQIAHGPNCWLGQRYAAVISALQKEASPVRSSASSPQGSQITVLYHSVEIWSDEDELLCGEVGYSIGQVYTSMTGFVSEKVREPGSKHNGAGILQLVSLGKLLQRHGYAFWNLGHPFNEKKNTMLYKRDIGGRVLDRGEYLRRWMDSRDRSTPHSQGIAALGAAHVACSSLLAPSEAASSTSAD